MRVPITPADPPKAGLDATARVYQREHALVGWIAGVRLDCGGAGGAPHGQDGKI